MTEANLSLESHRPFAAHQQRPRVINGTSFELRHSEAESSWDKI
jgi:hypothetical protein